MISIVARIRSNNEEVKETMKGGGEGDDYGR